MGQRQIAKGRSRTRQPRVQQCLQNWHRVGSEWEAEIPCSHPNGETFLTAQRLQGMGQGRQNLQKPREISAMKTSFSFLQICTQQPDKFSVLKTKIHIIPTMPACGYTERKENEWSWSLNICHFSRLSMLLPAVAVCSQVPEQRDTSLGNCFPKRRPSEH